MAAPYPWRKNRERRNVAAYRALIETPATEPFTAPANATCIARPKAEVTETTAAVSLAGYDPQVINVEPMAAGSDSTRFYVEADTVVTLENGWELYIDAGNRYELIAEVV